MDDPLFLTTEEATRLLNVHQNTIVRWIKSRHQAAAKFTLNLRSARHNHGKIDTQQDQGPNEEGPAKDDRSQLNKICGSARESWCRGRSVGQSAGSLAVRLLASRKFLMWW